MGGSADRKSGWLSTAWDVDELALRNLDLIFWLSVVEWCAGGDGLFG